MNKDIRKAFADFEAVVKVARKHRSKLPEMARLLARVFELAGKTKSDYAHTSTAPDRATIDRWFAGNNIPQDIYVRAIHEFLFGEKTFDSDFHFLATGLLNQRFHPVIHFLLDEIKAGRNIGVEQLSNLLWLAEKCKGEITPEIIQTFIGRN